MGRHAFHNTIYGIMIDDGLRAEVVDYYKNDFNLDPDGEYYDTELDKLVEAAKDEFGIVFEDLDEGSPYGYLGIELNSDEWFEDPHQMTYKQLQNRIRKATKDEVEDFKKRLYHFQATVGFSGDDKSLDDKCGYYQYWYY